jgi:hypothetical protein
MAVTATAAKAKIGRRPATPLSWTAGSVEGTGGEDTGPSGAGTDADGTVTAVARHGACVVADTARRRARRGEKRPFTTIKTVYCDSCKHVFVIG